MKHLFTIFLLCLVLQGYSKDIYVASKSKGKQLGTLKHPYSSIEKAIHMARKYVGKEQVNILFTDGIYYLDKTIILTPKDSGTEKFPVFYKAVNEGGAIISGGRELNVKWKPFNDGIVVCSVDGIDNIDQLFIGGERQEMARFPNSKQNKNVYDCWDLSHDNSIEPSTNVLSKEKISSWKNPKGAYLHAMHQALWGDMHWLIKGKDNKGDLIMEGGWQNNRPAPMHKKYRFVENVFEELDAPGEWFYNKEEAKLYYYPKPEIDLNKSKVEVVSLSQLLVLKGSEADPVSNIHFQGITFKHTARVFMENKEPLLRSDWTVYRGGAITMDGARYCSISNCEFDQLGGNSIFVNNYNRYINIKECYIHHGGANGIAFIGDPNAVRNPIFRYGNQNYANLDLTPGPKSNNYPAYCKVEDCLITKTGRVEKQTSPVQISMSYGITVSHCSIYDVPRAGINISEGTFGGHLIEYCDIFNTVLETGDHGSFNSWGRDRFWTPGLNDINREVAKNPSLPFLDMIAPNIIRNNRIRCDHGWDVDLDDGSSNYNIYNNLLLNGGLKLREGFGRTVTNNVIINNGFHPHVWPRNNGDVFKNNIVCCAHQPAAMTRGLGATEKWGKEVDYNLFTSNNTDRLKFAVNDCDLNSVVANPQFMDAASGDFRVKPNSKALELGFVNFDMSNYGVENPRLRALAQRPNIPSVIINPDTTYVAIPKQDIVTWMGAQIIVPRGAELSSYGVAFGTKGIALSVVPKSSKAWEMGFRTGDFITHVNNNEITSSDLFLRLLNKKKDLRTSVFSIVREQHSQEFRVK